MKTNYHTHSTWCDGKNTVREMIEAAIAKGFEVIGFSSHSEMLKDVPAYIAEVRQLAKEYQDRIEVKVGIEADGGDSLGFREQLDYVIGSVHFVKAADGAIIPVDWSPEKLQAGIDEHFGGEAKALVKSYFAAVRESLKFDFEVVGHPDLIRKFNTAKAGLKLFDENDEWYREELVKTADAIAKSGRIVEVNTGAISRGWLDDAYPSSAFRQLLRERGIRFILSSDSHSAESVDCAFERFGDQEEYVKELEC